MVAEALATTLAVGISPEPGGQLKLTPKQLAAYFARIGYEATGGPPCADARTLCELHYRHATTIPFENLVLGHPRFRVDDQEPIVLCIERLFKKIVVANRGGYCFESNLLFAAALRTLGFRMYTGSARMVWPSEEGDAPGSLRLNDHHSHVVHHVLLDDGSRWLTDVAAAGKNPLYALRVEEEPLQDPQEVPLLSSSRWRLRRGLPWTRQPLTPQAAALQPHRCGWYLQAYQGTAKGWEDVYFFTAMELMHGDLMCANFWMSTHPTSKWRSMVLVARCTAGGCVRLHNWTLQRFEGGLRVEERLLGDEEERLRVLRDEFGLAPDGDA